MKIRVRMLQTRQGQHNAFARFRYEAGKSYWLPITLARQYMEQGVAMEDKSIDIPETKVRKKKALR